MLGQRDLAGADHIATAAFDAIEESLLLRTRPLFTTDLAQQQLRQQLRRTRLCAVAAADAWHFGAGIAQLRSEEHTSESSTNAHLVCRLPLEKKKKTISIPISSTTQLHTYNYVQ